MTATDPNTGDIYRYNGTWSRVGGPGATFAVNANALYGLAPDRSGVYQWTGNGTTWTKIGGPASTIYAGGNDLFATDPNTGDIYRYNGVENHWSRVGGPRLRVHRERHVRVRRLQRGRLRVDRERHRLDPHRRPRRGHHRRPLTVTAS